MYPTDEQAKRDIIDIGKRMYHKGMVAANDGNISIKVSDNEIWATPTGVSKGFMSEDMLVKMDMDGNIIEGTYKSTSEILMHLRVYKMNPEAKAVTHAHPLTATAFAIAGIPLDKAILPEAVFGLGSVPIAPYATPTTPEVADSIEPYCNDYNGVLLASHGALSWGKDVFQAFYRMETIEYYANILMITGNIIGKATILSNEQITKLLEIRKKMGIPGTSVPCGYVPE